MTLPGDQHHYLRPVLPSDLGLIAEMELRPEVALKWRFSGETPDPRRYVQGLFAGVLEEHLVIDRTTSEAVGLVIAYNANLRSRHCYLGVLAHPDHDGSGAALAGAALAVHRLFTHWDLRVVYTETLAYNYDEFRSGEGTIFEVEAVLADHFYAGDRYWDQYLLAIHRDRWDDGIGRLVARRLIRTTDPSLFMTATSGGPGATSPTDTFEPVVIGRSTNS